MREPRAFAELETKIGQEEKPVQKPVEAKQEKPKTQLVNKSVDKPVGTSTKGVSVRDWVKKNYPREFQTDMIRGDLTFDDLGKAMESGDVKDFYSYASEGGKGFDSAVREEIFEGLSKHHGKPYDYYYDLWLNGPKKPAKEEFSFAPDPTDPDLERGYGPRIKKVMYRGDDIKKAKEAGWSDDQIVKALVDQGYDDEEAEDFVVNFDPNRFKDPKTNPARSWEAWDQEEEYARFDQELEDAYEYVYEGLPRDRQIAIFAERMDITPEKAKAYFDSLDKRQAEQKREYEANKPYREAKAEEARKKAKEAEDKRVEGLVAKIKEARMKGDEKTAQKLVDELVFPDGLPF